MTDILTALCLVAGLLLLLIATIGVVRLPDVLCRSHAVAKGLTLGIFLMLVGLWLHEPTPGRGLKITLAILFQILTIPISSHLVTRLAMQKNVPRWRHRPMEDHRTATSSRS